jgi:hypothetical protein
MIGSVTKSKTYRKKAGQCGHIYVTITFREDKPNRIDYVKIQGCTKQNDCLGSFTEAIADLLSFSIRRIRNKHEAEAIIKALRHHRCNRIAPSSEHTTSCADAIAQVLQKELNIDEVPTEVF